MNSENDRFDARLAQMFDEAEKPYRHMAESERFTREVTVRLARPERFRFLALAAAGSLGALIAGSQIHRLGEVQLPGIGGMAGPELLLSLVIGALALGFAAVLPRRPLI